MISDNDDDYDNCAIVSVGKASNSRRTSAHSLKQDPLANKENDPVEEAASCIPSCITVTQSSDESRTAYKKHCPVLERPVRGYTAERLLDIIVGDQVSNSSRCCRVPRGVLSMPLML